MKDANYLRKVIESVRGETPLFEEQADILIDLIREHIMYCRSRRDFYDNAKLVVITITKIRNDFRAFEGIKIRVFDDEDTVRRALEYDDEFPPKVAFEIEEFLKFENDNISNLPIKGNEEIFIKFKTTLQNRGLTCYVDLCDFFDGLFENDIPKFAIAITV